MPDYEIMITIRKTNQKRAAYKQWTLIRAVSLKQVADSLTGTLHDAAEDYLDQTEQPE